MKLICCRKNGNYTITLFDDGTKVRVGESDVFIPESPESIDIKITNRCDMGCGFCHENSLADGNYGDIMQASFIDTLPAYTELAIGGGNPLSHPDLVSFLKKLKEKKLVPSMTVNQKHFLENIEFLSYLRDEKLVYGLGISLTCATTELIEALRGFPNAVVHVINGVVTTDSIKSLYDKDIKILILGYKEFRRGVTYLSPLVERQKTEVYDLLPEILKHFDTVSFDNLAIKQLNPKRLMTNEEWSRFYMGDDGTFTMYIDMVKGEFAQSSISFVRHPIKSDIKEMFGVVKSERIQ